MRFKVIKLFFSIFIVILLLLLQAQIFKINVFADKNHKISMPGFSKLTSYDEYIKRYINAGKPEIEIVVPGVKYTCSENADVSVLKSFEGRRDVLEWRNEEGWVEWEVEIPQTGLYNLALAYYPIKGRGRDIEFELNVNDEVPFEGALKFEFGRVWRDETEVISDNQGNELRPRQIEAPRWLENAFIDTEGVYNEPYMFYFKKGRNTIKLKAIREPIVIDYIKIFNEKTLPTYEEVAGTYKNISYKFVDDLIIKVQAEKAYLKSHPVLHPLFDKSSPKTEPYHPNKIRMNTIGGGNWRYPAQWISWEFDVPQDGFYKIGMRYRQNQVRGFFTTRKIYIDGKIPFKEMNNIDFPYGINWQLKILGDDNPYLFYLTKGRHEIKMEVTPGYISETLRIVQDSIYKLNYIYRKIIMITSVQPDIYRDYYLEKEIPDLITTFNEVEKTLRAEAFRLEKVIGKKGTEAVLLLRIAEQLKSLAEHPETIPERLNKYKDNISALAAWILKIKEQPLELDYILIQSPQSSFKRVKENIAEKIVHEFRAFIGSFFENYNNVGNRYETSKSLNVWIGTGRDQASILKSMIDDLFTPKTGISVNLSLVQGALLQATMAGKGPDIALTVGRGEPVNLALRGAVEPLDKFNGFDEITKRFMNTAMVPYELRGHYYALPETQIFFMMFYRKDIFDELGLKPPDTWQDFYDIAPVIQRNNMQLGLPYLAVDAYSLIGMGMGAQSILPTLMLQNGKNFYNDEKTETTFSDPISYKAFKEWTNFYTQNSFPLFKDDYNRFRTGEMPITIAHYSFYNMLAVAAPEIKNMWDMVPIPGIENDDGTINRTTSASGSSSIILSSARDKYAAWEFLKWWSSAEVQARFGNEAEGIMGPAARYTPANKEAFMGIPWSYKEQKLLLKQWHNVVEIPEIPGGYITQRNIDNAFRAVVFRWQNPREVLNYWNNETNKELRRKRAEFGIDKE